MPSWLQTAETSITFIQLLLKWYLNYGGKEAHFPVCKLAICVDRVLFANRVTCGMAATTLMLLGIINMGSLTASHQFLERSLTVGRLLGKGIGLCWGGRWHASLHAAVLHVCPRSGSRTSNLSGPERIPPPCSSYLSRATLWLASPRCSRS